MAEYNKQRDIIAGLRILQGTDCAAEHDEFAAEAGHELDAAQRARLHELGWLLNDTGEGARWWVIYV